MSASASAEENRRGFASSVGRWTDAHPYTFFSLLSAWYIALVWSAAQRPLWYDELFTFYLAQQPTVARMMAALHTIDLNPPLNYVLTRWSIGLFGAKPWATRLPEMVAFWAGSLAIYVLLRRRASALLAALGVLLLWSTPYFFYATEARPYGLLLGLTAVLLTSWEAASRNGDRSLCLTLVAISGFLLLFSHVFGLLSLGAVWAGEIVRNRGRRLDAPMLVALALPLLATLTYRPLFHSAGAIAFPPEAAVTWNKLYYLYFSIFRWMWRPLLVLLVAMLLSRDKLEPEGTSQGSLPGFHTALALLFLVPVGLTIVFLRSHSAFYDRYGMVTVLPIAIATPLLLARRTRSEAPVRFWSLIAVGILLLFSTTMRAPIRTAVGAVLPAKPAAKFTGILITSPHGPFRPWFKNLPVPRTLLDERERAPAIESLTSFDTDLPIVAASELTFFEMDQRESDALDRRLYHLYDRDAELAIAHRSIADGVLNAKQFFPVRANIEAYQPFRAQHTQFLVIGTYEHPGDWLLRKAVLDGASLQIVARYPGYADSDIYLVSYPAHDGSQNAAQ